MAFTDIIMAEHYVFGMIAFAAFAVATSSANCIVKHVNTVEECSFHIICYGHISDGLLPNECLGSTNNPVTVDLTFNDEADTFNDYLDLDFITTLRVNSVSSKRIFSIVRNASQLSYLYLADSGISQIDDYPFYYLNHLKLLDLSHNNLENIDSTFQFDGENAMLRYLNLAHNKISIITNQTFEDLSLLIQLDLSYNYIEDLSKNPFQDLRNLVTLNINYNKIKYIDGAISNLRSLRNLHLKGNQITTLDEDGMVIKHLEILDMTNNSLKYVAPIIFFRHWAHIDNCKIILSQNHITSIPNSSFFDTSLDFENIEAITEIDLSRNDIQNVELNAFENILKLIALDLSSNKIENFNIVAKYLTNLNLSNNYITNLTDESFFNIIRLENLDLSHNNIQHVSHHTFKNNIYLKNVNLTYNKIKELTSLHVSVFHPHGGNLDLSNNHIIVLDISMSEYRKLERLNLRSNNINDISFINLRYCFELKYIQLSNNSIKSLTKKNMLLPSSLIYLDLNVNKIQSIEPSTFIYLNNMVTLFLSYNELTVLEYGTFQGLHSLMFLDLSHNKLRHFSSNVLTELKSLKHLSLAFNNIVSFDYKALIGHQQDIEVFVDGNIMSCDWLHGALKDYTHGYSKMKLSAHFVKVSGPSVDGIPCKTLSDLRENLSDTSSREMSSDALADERLLNIHRQILMAITNQTSLLKSFLSKQQSPVIWP